MPCAIVTGGEATVVVRGDGTGGPNQGFALTLALELEGVEGWTSFAADTDGASAGAMRAGGVDPEGALANNDARAALAAGGALLVTGPTGTNVNGLRVALVSGPG